MKPTEEEIEIACEDFKSALLTSLEVDKRETATKLEKIKVHRELLIAKDNLYSLKFN